MRTTPLFLIGSVVAAFAVSPAPAIAQQPASKVQVSATASSITPSRAGTAGNRWACAAQAQAEIYPVSSDVVSGNQAYVLVRMEKGEAVSSERISAKDVDSLRRLGCSPKEKPDYIG